MGGSKRKASKNNGKSMGGSEVEGRATYILKKRLKSCKVGEIDWTREKGMKIIGGFPPNPKISNHS